MISSRLDNDKTMQIESMVNGERMVELEAAVLKSQALMASFTHDQEIMRAFSKINEWIDSVKFTRHLISMGYPVTYLAKEDDPVVEVYPASRETTGRVVCHIRKNGTKTVFMMTVYLNGIRNASEVHAYVDGIECDSIVKNEQGTIEMTFGINAGPAVMREHIMKIESLIDEAMNAPLDPEDGGSED